MQPGWSDERFNTLHRRAIELQPAIAAASLENDVAGSEILYNEYLNAARQLRVSARDAWMVYAIASVNWTKLLIDERATRDGVDARQAAQMTILATQAWVNAGG